MFGPVMGAWIIKYFANIFSAINENILHELFGFLPQSVQDFVVPLVGLFVGEGWELTLGLLFVLVVVFLPGGLMEGYRRVAGMFTGGPDNKTKEAAPKTPKTPQGQPANGDKGI